MKLHTTKARSEISLTLTVDADDTIQLEGAPDWLTVKAIKDGEGKITITVRSVEIGSDDVVPLFFNGDTTLTNGPYRAKHNA